MTVRQVPVRNPETGATAHIPETALPHFAGWERTDRAPVVEPSTEQAAERGTTQKEGRRRG